MYVFSRKIGVAGVALGTVASLILTTIYSPLQVEYFIYSRKYNKLKDILFG